MVIVLLGYMGSGKSTVGQIIANKLKFQFSDLDSVIETQEGLSVEHLFKTKGEIYFRKKEAQHFKDLITNSSNLVLSLGGGTPCYGSNMSVLKQSGARSIYLKTSIGTILDRLREERKTRPLISHLASDNDLLEFIGKHLFERQAFYYQSEFVLSTDEKTPEEIAEDIIDQLL